MTDKKQGNPWDMSNLFNLGRNDLGAAVPDLSEFLQGLHQSLPGFDPGTLLAQHQKNLQALATANRLAVEGVQALAEREAEILREGLEKAAAAAQELTQESQPGEALARQMELINDAFAEGLRNMRELADMSIAANREALDAVNTRFTESLAEFAQAAKGGSR